MKTLILLIQFFTRIPLPIQINMDEINLKKGSALLPFVGVIIGAWNWLIFTLVALVMPLPVAIIAGLFCRGYHYWRVPCGCTGGYGGWAVFFTKKRADVGNYER